jgi:hypothetical protein
VITSLVGLRITRVDLPQGPSEQLTLALIEISMGFASFQKGGNLYDKYHKYYIAKFNASQ